MKSDNETHSESQPRPPARAPNIVFVLAEDMGWGDLGCYGNRDVKTPHLDHFATEGTLFTRYYSPAPVCSPARAGLVTGRFPARARIHSYLKERPEVNARRNMDDFLSPGVPLMPRIFQQAGYRTGHFGKWHLGNTAGAPEVGEYGFEEVKVWCQGNGPGYEEKRSSESSRVIVNSALEFTRRKDDRPYFANVWLRDMHSELNPSPEQLAAFPDIYTSDDLKHFTSAKRIYYSALTAMDKELGRLFRSLETSENGRETLVIFTADHGPDCSSHHATYGNPGPFRGRKYSLYEGGLRVPFILRWPGRTPAGSVDEKTVLCGVDLLPTLAKLAGVTLPDIGNEISGFDGEDMSSAFLGKALKRQRDLFFHYSDHQSDHHINHSPKFAMVRGPWKYLCDDTPGSEELYNVVEAPNETGERSARDPEICREMSEALTRWRESVPTMPSRPRKPYPWPHQVYRNRAGNH